MSHLRCLGSGSGYGVTNIAMIDAGSLGVADIYGVCDRLAKAALQQKLRLSDKTSGRPWDQ